MEGKKTCHSCGADVTHATRHKNRHGEYLCSKCLETRDQAREHKARQHVRRTCRRAFLYAILAVAAGWIFLKVLDAMNQPGD